MLLERLKKQSGLSETQLERIAATASKRYKVFQIPKRKGGFRTIAQPSKEIKAIQRWLIRALVSKFPIHECATAYKKGASIRSNAFRHSLFNFTLRADFRTFFPSFSGDNRELFFRETTPKVGLELTVPIRLTQTPPRCRVRPRAGIKVGIGRRLNPARDAEQRAERVERVEPPVEAERELIEVGL